MSTKVADNYGVGEFPGPGADGLIDALPCRSCGTETLSILEVDMYGVIPAFWVYLCRPCQSKTRGDLTALRRLAEVPS